MPPRARWCSFKPGAQDPYVEFALDPAANRTGQVWHAFVEGLDAGGQYGYRFDMQPNPNPQVYRFDPSRTCCSIPTHGRSPTAAHGANIKPGKRPYRNGLVVENAL